jgi:hypothetical protein
MARKEEKKAEKRAKGGSTKANEYNAKGSPAMKAASDSTDGFKRGGKVKRKDGGRIEGEKSKERLDKRARGGSPYSSGRATTPRDDSRGNERNHEGDMPGRAV